MTKKLHQYFWILVFAILMACQNEAISEEPPNTATTPSVPATSTTTLSTETQTATPLRQFPLDGYVMVLNKDGNLFFQDGNNLPIQLTQGGEKPYSLILSDDNKKLVFGRGENFDNLYSVNTDGSDERVLITKQWLSTLEEGTTIRFPSFVPNTNQLLFNTYLCATQEYKPPCTIGLFLVDTSLNVIKEILPPNKLDQYDYDGNFKTSPDGKMVSVVMSGHIDIFDMDGKFIRQNVLPYKPSAPSELFPEQYWLPDSSGLIVAIPKVTEFGLVFPPRPAYNIWRYTIDSDLASEISFDPPPRLSYGGCGDVVKVSPDGNLILYVGGDDLSLYIGNLNNGDTQRYKQYACPWYSSYPWSPDSKKFIYGEHYLSFLDLIAIPSGGMFLEWIDSNHYTYIALDGKRLVGEINGDVISTYELGPFSLIKQK